MPKKKPDGGPIGRAVTKERKKRKDEKAFKEAKALAKAAAKKRDNG